ncbi:hypothetical protein IE53DRAFT_37876 [Violaceomyces palustris]|uniref:Uncharacterized protein n=1 Tax=Violaceomyces palustris TaxID=1673888 RepID=A0ACD0P0X5_9BASI|nr:hypothetical protein IE53DRAFT_37876 [Violaceomyces palustris]
MSFLAQALSSRLTELGFPALLLPSGPSGSVLIMLAARRPGVGKRGEKNTSFEGDQERDQKESLHHTVRMIMNRMARAKAEL